MTTMMMMTHSGQAAGPRGSSPTHCRHMMSYSTDTRWKNISCTLAASVLALNTEDSNLFALHHIQPTMNNMNTSVRCLLAIATQSDSQQWHDSAAFSDFSLGCSASKMFFFVFFLCALRQRRHRDIALITSLPVPDCPNFVQHLQPRCLGGQIPPSTKEGKQASLKQRSLQHHDSQLWQPKLRSVDHQTGSLHLSALTAFSPRFEGFLREPVYQTLAAFFFGGHKIDGM